MSRKSPKIQKVDPRDLKANEAFAPKPDPVFQHLLVEAVNGRLPVYFAVIAFRRVKRFDTGHRPELTVPGKRYVTQIVESWNEDECWPIWVYPSGDKFIASDDYFSVAACERAEFEHVPCYVLGLPDGPDVAHQQGPLSVEQVKQVLGFA